MTIEEKAKRYDKALELAKRKLCFDKAGLEDSYTPNDLYEIFPELKESEDEKVREALIDLIYKIYANTSYITCDEHERMLAWLEKQGNKPQGKSALEATKEAKVGNANKVEPKFDVDDWVVRKDGKNFADGRKTVRITRFDGERYWFDSGTYLQPKDIRLWTIADAKAGDVLDANGTLFIYKKHDKHVVYFYCGVDLADEFMVANGNDIWNDNYKVYPATKEQRNLLFSKMHEAGYEWDEEKLELKKIASDNAEQDRLPFIWHDAAKELPPKHDDYYSEEVLVHTLSGSRFMLKYNYSINRWTNSFRITHWAYLPEPPKTE